MSASATEHRLPGPVLLALGAQVEALYNRAHERTGVRRDECVVHVDGALARRLRDELRAMGCRAAEGSLELEVLGIPVREDPWLAAGLGPILCQAAGVRGGLPITVLATRDNLGHMSQDHQTAMQSEEQAQLRACDDLARIAYDVHCASAPRAEARPDWESLPEAERDAWRAVVAGVLGARESAEHGARLGAWTARRDQLDAEQIAVLSPWRRGDA